MRILHIHGSGQHASEIAALLKNTVFSIDRAACFNEASEIVATNVYDVTVVDLDSVASQDLTALAEFCANREAPHVLACASQDDPGKLVAALDGGASDFIMLPLRPSEFKLRIMRAAMQGNAREKTAGPSMAQFGTLQLDVGSGDIWENGQRMDLTPRERNVLQVLIRSRGSIVDKPTIASRVFSLDGDANPKSIELYVHRLRKKLGNANVQIETVRGLGYRLTTAAGKSA
ncbi:MAG: winged helix-turn-helix domain-containing protein [Filomicrobium sp.]